MRMLKRFIKQWQKITRGKRQTPKSENYFEQFRKNAEIDVGAKQKGAQKPIPGSWNVKTKTGSKSTTVPETRAIALPEPVLIDYLQAQTALKKALKEITDYEGFMVLNVFDLNREKRSYTVKNGIWAGAKMRMFFAQNSQGKLERFYIGTNSCGYPVLRDPETSQEAEVRMVTVEELPEEKNVNHKASQREAAAKTVASISSTGELPDWAVKIKQIIETRDICGAENKSDERSLLEIADELHEIACDILGLNPEKIPRRDDVEEAFKGRIRVMHPDKVQSYRKDAQNIAQALLWAKKFLYPFNV